MRFFLHARQEQCRFPEKLLVELSIHVSQGGTSLTNGKGVANRVVFHHALRLRLQGRATHFAKLTSIIKKQMKNYFASGTSSKACSAS